MFNKPNYTQTPNDFFDEVAKTLKEGELRVMLVIMRQTFGWGNKQWDRISLSQFVEKTGMEEKSVCRSLQTLIEKKLVMKHKEGPIGREKVWYSLVVESPAEFEKPIDDSNNSYPCPKDRGTPVLKTDTKETSTSISPIVPKGDSSSRKSKRQEKIERATEVWTTSVQHADLESRCRHENVELQDCYNRLSAWKIGKEITGGKNDYKAMVNWVIDSVAKDKSPKPKRESNAGGKSFAQMAGEIEEKNRQWAYPFEKIYKSYEEEGLINFMPSSWEFVLHKEQRVAKISYVDKDFINRCKDHLEELGIIV